MGINPTRPALARNRRTPYDIDSSRADGTMEVDRRPVEQVPVCRPTRRGLAPAVQQPSVKELSAQPCPTADRTRLVRVRDARHTWAVRSTPALLSDRCTSARGTPQAFCRENRLWCCDDATPQGTGRRSTYFEKSTFGACAAPGVCSSKYSRGPLPSTLAVNTWGKRRM